MDPLRLALLGALLPGAIAASGLLLIWLMPGGVDHAAQDGSGHPADCKPPKGRLWLVPPLLVLAYVPAHVAARPGVTPWPAESSERMAPLVAIAAVWAMLEVLFRPPALVRHGCRFVLFSAVAWAILQPLHRPGELEGWGFWVAAGSLGAVMAVSAALAAFGLSRAHAAISGLVLGVASAGLAALLAFFAHYAIGGMRAGGVAAMMGGVGVAALAGRRRAALPAEAAVVVLALLGSLAIAGRWFGGSWDGGWRPIPMASIVLALAAPGALALPALLGAKRRPAVDAAIGAGGAAVLVAAACLLAHFDAPPSAPADSDPYAAPGPE